ncbi:MAG: dTDP-4-dehydrorhamnose reductase [Ramlibacter sp.]
MKILLFGSSGQLGSQLRRSLRALGEVVPLTREATPLCGDLLCPAEAAAAIAAVRPQVVVNAAAFTDVDGAESHPALAQAVNAAGPEALARACADTGAWLVHFSSDYVYDGSGDRPWRESDPARPLGAYGRSKLAGDLAIVRAHARHVILRTSWLFEPGHRNFAAAVLGAALQRDRLEVVDDQWGAPTRAALVADVTAQVLRTLASDPAADRLAGLYHLAADGWTSRHAAAALLLLQARRQGLPVRTPPDGLVAVSTASTGRAAPRPLNSRLDTTRLRTVFGLALPPWQDGIADFVARTARESGEAA